MPTCYATYIVQSGDVIYQIAKYFRVDTESILRANPTVDPNNMQVGTVLCIPTTSCPFGSTPYTIQRGDTYGSIGARFGIEVADIAIANPGVNPRQLRIGQIICIPQNTPKYPPCDSMNFYVLRKGDTLSIIAKAYDITVEELMRVNPTLNPYRLQVGQIICIPVVTTNTSIIVNKSAKILTFLRNGRIVKEYPVAIGKPSTPTPEGHFEIINKQVNPGGPYGTRWLGLSKRGYGIHGTNNPASIGTAASNGCIRMNNADIEELFSQVGVGTDVRILP